MQEIERMKLFINMALTDIIKIIKFTSKSFLFCNFNLINKCRISKYGE